MKTEWERERMRQRGEKEAKKERVRFCFFALVIPSEIDSHSSRDLPMSPFSPSSRLYYIPVQRMNDLHITHEYRWPVHTSVTTRAQGPHRRSLETEADTEQERGDGWRKEKEWNLIIEMSVGKRKSKRVKSNAPKWWGKKEWWCD